MQTDMARLHNMPARRWKINVNSKMANSGGIIPIEGLSKIACRYCQCLSPTRNTKEVLITESLSKVERLPASASSNNEFE